jgi:hypothetical protein
MGEMKSGLTLTADEHLRAEELIGELQDRLQELQARNDDHISKSKRVGRASSYEPWLHSIQFGDSTIVVQVGQGRVAVSHNGKDVVRIFGQSLDLIDLDGLSKAMLGVRQYMILDDLANV